MEPVLGAVKQAVRVNEQQVVCVQDQHLVEGRGVADGPHLGRKARYHNLARCGALREQVSGAICVLCRV